MRPNKRRENEREDVRRWMERLGYEHRYSYYSSHSHIVLHLNFKYLLIVDISIQFNSTQLNHIKKKIIERPDNNFYIYIFGISGSTVRSFLTVLSKAITAPPMRAWLSPVQFFCHMETALSVSAQRFGSYGTWHMVSYMSYILRTQSSSSQFFLFDSFS